MSNRWPEVTDAASLEVWIRGRGFDPAEYADWDCSVDGPPPWAECVFDAEAGSWSYSWPVINVGRRMIGVVEDE